MTFCYSTDEEEYYGDFATFDEAAAELEGRGGWVAEAVPSAELVDVRLVDVEVLVEAIDERLGEHIAADDYVVTMTRPNMLELADVIREFVKTRAEFHRHGVKNERRVEPFKRLVCSRCREVFDELGPAWRLLDGQPQHKCTDADPQVGYFDTVPAALALEGDE